MRKIIQIATTSPAIGISQSLLSTTRTKCEPHLFALCDDGTVWVMGLNTSPQENSWSGWERVPDLPQE